MRKDIICSQGDEIKITDSTSIGLAKVLKTQVASKIARVVSTNRNVNYYKKFFGK